ncbi:unnamed protein product [Meloidogyne enterolobii]|uniref:Uncharacterized protein n=1 Tax=Meloidogyne enterolobii TaxID=390850 RepID=A0ACB1AUR6_MELEN
MCIKNGTKRFCQRARCEDSIIGSLLRTLEGIIRALGRWFNFRIVVCLSAALNFAVIGVVFIF